MLNNYKTYFDAMPCFLTVQDRDFRIIDANRKFRKNFGEWEGRHCYQVYKHRPEKCEVCPVEHVFRDGEPHHSEEWVTALNGEEIWVIVNTTPIFDEKGEIIAVMEMSTDITMIRELQDKLSDVGLLIGTISHTIKGLLNGLDGGIYLVNSGLKNNDRERIDKGWEMALRNMDRIRSLVMDLLYYVKDREPERQIVIVKDLIEDICSIMDEKARKLTIHCECSIDPDAGTLEADPTAIRSLFVNLMENALDACRLDRNKSDHRVNMAVRGEPDQVIFTLTDTGTGMTREMREKAFSLFFSSKGSGGTGLGLFVANKIARAHGGTISIDSEPGKGSCITVKLPRKSSEKNPAGSERPPTG